jgi:hypothetical protein
MPLALWAEKAQQAGNRHANLYRAAAAKHRFATASVLIQKFLRHEALYDEIKGRVEMRLVSLGN